MPLRGTSYRLVSDEKTKHLDVLEFAHLISLFLMLHTVSTGSILEHSTLRIYCFICIFQQYLCIFQSSFFSMAHYPQSLSPITCCFCCFIPCKASCTFTAIILIAFSCRDHDFLNSTRQ